MFKQNRLIYAKEHHDDWLPGTEITDFESSGRVTSAKGLPPELVELLERKDTGQIEGFELTEQEVLDACTAAAAAIEQDIRTTMAPTLEGLEPAAKVQAEAEMEDLITQAKKSIEGILEEYKQSMVLAEELLSDPYLPGGFDADYENAKAKISETALNSLITIIGLNYETSSGGTVTKAGQLDAAANNPVAMRQTVLALRQYSESTKRSRDAVAAFMGGIQQDPTMSAVGDNPIDQEELASVAKYASSEFYFGDPDFANAPKDEIRGEYFGCVLGEFRTNLQIQEHENRDDSLLPDLIGDDMSAESVAWQFQDSANAGDYEPTHSWDKDAIAAGTAVGRTTVEVDDALFGKQQAVQIGTIPTFQAWHKQKFENENGLSYDTAKEKAKKTSDQIEDFLGKTKDLEGQIKTISPLTPLEASTAILVANAATLQASADPNNIIYYTEYSDLDALMTSSEEAMKTQLKAYRDTLVQVLDGRQADIDSFKSDKPEFSEKTRDIKAILVAMGDELSLSRDLTNLKTKATETQTLLDELDAALQERFEAKRKEQLDKLNGLETLLKTPPFSGVEGVSVLEEQRQDLIQKVTEAKTEAEIESLTAEVTTFIETVKAKELEYKKGTGEARAKGLREGGFTKIPEESELKTGFGSRLDQIDTALTGSDIAAIDAALEDLTKLEEEITAALVELAKSSDTTPRSGSDAADRTSPGVVPVPTPSVGPGGASPSASGGPAEEPEVVDEVKDSTPIHGESGPGEIDTAISALLGTDSTPALIAATLGVLAGPDGSSYVTDTDGNPVTLDTSEGNIYKRLIKAAKAKGGIRIEGEIIAVAKGRLSSGSHSGDLEEFNKQKEKALETTSSAGSSSGDDGPEDDDSSTADDAPESREHTPARTREEIIRIIERSGTCDMASIIESVLGPDLPEKYREELLGIIIFSQDNGWKKLSIGESKTFFDGDLIITRKAEDAFEIHFNNIRVPGESQDVNIYIFVSDKRLTFNIQLGTDETDGETLVIETSDRVEQLHGLVLEPMEEDDLATRKAIKLRELRDISGLRKREMENFLTFQYKDTVDYSTALEPSQSLGGLKRGKIRRQSIKTHFDDVSRFDGGSVGIPGAGESNRYVAAIDDLKLQVDSLRDRVEFPNLRNLPISAVIDILVQAEWADEHSFRLPKGRTYHTEQVRIENNGRFALRNNSDYQFTYRPK